MRVQAVYGGADIGRQIRGLKDRPHIVVGTPGRMLDHINRHTLKLGTVQTLVLDEADEMLNMGFLEDIEKLFPKFLIKDKHYFSQQQCRQPSRTSALNS